jgi:hypothetical protein
METEKVKKICDEIIEYYGDYVNLVFTSDSTEEYVEFITDKYLIMYINSKDKWSVRHKERKAYRLYETSSLGDTITFINSINETYMFVRNIIGLGIGIKFDFIYDILKTAEFVTTKEALRKALGETIYYIYDELEMR